MKYNMTNSAGDSGPNTLVIFDGNSSTIQKFKVEADEWHSIPNGFSKDMVSWSFTAAALGKALLIFLSNKTVFRFQRSKSGRSCWMKLPSTTFNHGEKPPVVVFKDHVYLIGSGGVGSHSSNIEKFSIPKNKWEKLENLSSPRRNHSLAVTSDAIYVICGIGRSGVMSAIEKYAVSSSSWKKVVDLKEPRHSAAAVASGNDIFVLGGFVKGNRTNDFLHISMPCGDCTKLTRMKITRTAFVAFIVDGKIYAVGGDNRQHDSVETYDAAQDKWEILDILSTLRVQAAFSMTLS